MNATKQYILEHIDHLPKYAEQSARREGTKRFNAIRKRRVGVKRLRTIERMLKLRGKLLPVKLFNERYRSAGQLRSLGLMMERIETQWREEDELEIRDALKTYTGEALKNARAAFKSTRKITDTGPESSYNEFAQWRKTAKHVIKRNRGSSLIAIANKYAYAQMTRIGQECSEINRPHAYDSLHSIRKRIKHCMYIAQMLNDEELRTRSATINGMIGERNDRCEFAEFVKHAVPETSIPLEYATHLRTVCEQQADSIFTHLQSYVRL